MDFDYCIEKLATLFTFDSKDILAKDMLTELTEIGCIAGGSLVFCETGVACGDIDLFFFGDFQRNKDKFKEIVDKYTEIDYCLGDPIKVFLKGASVPIQLVFTYFRNVNELLRSFDMDYVQAGLHKNEIVVTDVCKEAWSTKVCSWTSYYQNRNMKACNKGFKVPYNLSISQRDDDPDLRTSFESFEPTLIRYSEPNLHYENIRYVDFGNTFMRIKETDYFPLKLERDVYQGDLFLYTEKEDMRSFPLRLTIVDVNHKNEITLDKKLSCKFQMWCKFVWHPTIFYTENYWKEFVYECNLGYVDGEMTVVVTDHIEGNMWILPSTDLLEHPNYIDESKKIKRRKKWVKTVKDKTINDPEEYEEM